MPTSTVSTLLSLVVALTLAAPVAHAAPAGSPPSGAAKKPGKQAQARPRPGAEAKALRLRTKALQAALDGARTEREQALARVRPLLDGGRHERAAEHLLEAALTLNDATLHIDAAEQFLAGADRRRPDALKRAEESTAAARTLLAASVRDPLRDPDIDVRTVRIAGAEIDDQLERCADVERRIVDRGDGLRRQRRGRQELATGASLLVVGLTGVGVMASGMVYRGARNDELAAIAGHEAEYDLTALDAQGRRADAMIGAGAVIGVVGVVLGASLVGLGVRDLRGKMPGRHAQLRVAPTLGGLVLSGRF